MQQVEPETKEYTKELIEIFKKRIYERNFQCKEKIVEHLNKFDFFARRVDSSDTKIILDVSKYLELKTFKAGDILYEKDEESKFIGFVLGGKFGKYDLIDPSATLDKKLRAKEACNNEIHAEPKRNPEQKESVPRLKLELVHAGDTNTVKMTEKTAEIKHPQLEVTEKLSDICANKHPTSPHVNSVRNPRTSTKKLKIVPEKQEVSNNQDPELLNLVTANPELSKFMTEEGPLIKRIKTVVAGESFGERSLTKNQSRSNTVICIEDGFILKLSETNFNKFFQEKQDEEEVEKLDFFLNVFKNNISTERIKHIVYHFSEVTFKPRKVIYSEGEATDALYFIKEGNVNLFKNYQSPQLTEEDQILDKAEERPLYSYRHPGLKDTKMMPLCSIGPLSYFGEEVIQKQESRQYTAVTETPTVLYKLRARTYYRFERQFKGIKRHIDEKSAVQDEWRNENILQKHNQAKENINNEIARTRPVIHMVKVRPHPPKADLASRASYESNETQECIINGYNVTKKPAPSFRLGRKTVRNYESKDVIDWRTSGEREKREVSEDSRVAVLTDSVAKFLKHNYRPHSVARKNLIEEGTKYDLELSNNPAPVGKIPFLWEPHVLYFPKPKLTYQFDHSTVNASKSTRPTTAGTTGIYGLGNERPSNPRHKIITSGSQSFRPSHSIDMLNNSGRSSSSRSHLNLLSMNEGSRFVLNNSSSTTSLIIKSYTKAPEMNPKIVADLQKVVKSGPKQQLAADANKRPCVSLNNLDDYFPSGPSSWQKLPEKQVTKTPRTNRNPGFPKQTVRENHH